MRRVLPAWASVGKRFSWRRGLGLAGNVMLSLCFAGLTGLAAQVRVPLPFTPVPITGQVFAVLLGGVFLGGGYGALSQILYLGMGAAGVPWLAGGGSGLPLGPTGYTVRASARLSFRPAA